MKELSDDFNIYPDLAVATDPLKLQNEIFEDLATGKILIKTGIRVINIFQRYCLECGKILPMKIKQNYAHNCEKPDFLL